MSHGLSPHITVSQPSKPTKSVTLSREEKRRKNQERGKREGGKEKGKPLGCIGHNVLYVIIMTRDSIRTPDKVLRKKRKREKQRERGISEYTFFSLLCITKMNWEDFLATSFGVSASSSCEYKFI